MATRKLQRKERMAIAAGVMILIALVVTPLMRDLSRRHARSEVLLREAAGRLEDTLALRQRIELEREGHNVVAKRVQSRGPRFNLYTFADTCLREYKLEGRARLEIKGKLSSGRSLDGVEVELKGINMEELTNFLHRLYDNDNLITLQGLRYLRPARDGKGLDCEMTFITPRV